ncbi:MAG: M23 family metallopeptidase [Bacteroidetes bacterium]|nr:M23 family metallopeptidase [Bacteroidota bacterium]
MSKLSTAQQPYNGSGLIYPLDKTPVVTGNYGELRSNHFHAGIDFVTDPKLHLPIRAVDDGYISRIKISPYGYGKVLYITHKNGLVSVYAHQQRYAWKTDRYVKAEQIRQQKNDIELFPAPGELPVKKGDIIGYTGNTGGSTGPHLHFELRDEKTETPVNPLLIYHVADTVKPKVTHLAFYKFQDTLIVPVPKLVPLSKKAIRSDSLALSGSFWGIGFAGYDKENEGTNPNNIYGARLWFDQLLVYQHELNNIHFDEGRFVNAFCDKQEGLKIQHCFTPQCYRIQIYKQTVNGGLLTLRDTLWHDIKLEVYDEAGNTSSYSYHIRSKSLSLPDLYSSSDIAACNKDIKIQQEDFELFIPAYTLYYSLNRKLNAGKTKTGYTVGNPDILMNNSATVRMHLIKPVPELISKYAITVNGNFLNTKADNDWLVAECKSLGTFRYVPDTTAPSIKPVLSKKKLLNIGKASAIGFKIADSQSGIGNYHVYINDVWHIAEYDAKNDLLTCNFTDETASGKITIRVVVEDKMLNKKEITLKTTRQ